eukprot:TRINITY_DN69_c0_g1_i5.p1 TRINITY_DN69_c0_g1~~TRINITY_DN69_c0_g1_i5.p1  ORF type:complete len:399 (-),score=38.53 TRINITY_DN69_c0_g1_i5:116-1312(-)
MDLQEQIQSLPDRIQQIFLENSEVFAKRERIIQRIMFPSPSLKKGFFHSSSTSEAVCANVRLQTSLLCILNRVTSIKFLCEIEKKISTKKDIKLEDIENIFNDVIPTSRTKVEYTGSKTLQKEYSNTQSRSTGERGYREFISNQPWSTGERGYMELGNTQPWSTGERGYMELGNTQPWSTGERGYMELGNTQSRSTGERGYMELGNTQSRSTGERGYMELGNTQSRSTGERGYMELGNTQSWSTGERGHKEFSNKIPQREVRKLALTNAFINYDEDSSFAVPILFPANFYTVKPLEDATNVAVILYVEYTRHTIERVKERLQNVKKVPEEVVFIVLYSTGAVFDDEVPKKPLYDLGAKQIHILKFPYKLKNGDKGLEKSLPDFNESDLSKIAALITKV